MTNSSAKVGFDVPSSGKSRIHPDHYFGLRTFPGGKDQEGKDYLDEDILNALRDRTGLIAVPTLTKRKENYVVFPFCVFEAKGCDGSDGKGERQLQKGTAKCLELLDSR
jgi:hypothetical protein